MGCGGGDFNWGAFFFSIVVGVFMFLFVGMIVVGIDKAIKAKQNTETTSNAKVNLEVQNIWKITGRQKEEVESGVVYKATLQNDKGDKKTEIITQEQYNSLKIGESENKLNSKTQWTVTSKASEETNDGIKYKLNLQNNEGKNKVLEVTKEEFDSRRIKDKIEL